MVSEYHMSHTSRPGSSNVFKRRMLEKIHMADDIELAKMGKDVTVNAQDIKLAVRQSDVNNEDRASIITQDRLKKFNELFGYE